MLLQRHTNNVQSRGLSTLLAASTNGKLHITELLTLAEDDVVEQLDAEDFAGPFQAVGNLDLFRRASK